MGVTGKLTFKSSLTIEEIESEYKRITSNKDYNIRFVKLEYDYITWEIHFDDVDNVDLVEKLGRFPNYKKEKVYENKYAFIKRFLRYDYHMNLTDLNHLRKIGKVIPQIKSNPLF